MGQWNITIRGTGCHHNSNPAIDADLMAADFVRRLKAAGMTILAASITTGGDYDLQNPDEYITLWNKDKSNAPQEGK